MAHKVLASASLLTQRSDGESAPFSVYLISFAPGDAVVGFSFCPLVGVSVSPCGCTSEMSACECECVSVSEQVCTCVRVYM